MEYLSRGEFYTTLKTATEPAEIAKFFDRTCSWDWRYTKRDQARAIRKAIELVSSVKQGCDLWKALGGFVSTPRQDNRLLNKMVDLIKTEEELRLIYNLLGCEEKEIERRKVIRRIFDKADRLRIMNL